jgi:bifunctional DNA-binding transcriptional regulator/antitoxin component of YhaV-PrlF toxin-antitoxin module
MTAAPPKFEKAKRGKVYRAKVTGRHAITLPAELCRALGIEVGDSVELVYRGESAELRPTSDVPVLPITALRGILKPYFPDSASIRAFLDEERAGWDEREALHDQIWEGKWPKNQQSDE